MRNLIILFFMMTSYSQTNTESWYTYWGIGYSKITYPGQIQILVDALKEVEGVTNTPINMDLLGFYWHVSDKTIAGVVINAAGDRYEANGEWFQINQYIYGISAMHYLGNDFGSGLFLRTDIGSANIVLDNSSGSYIGSESGLGYLVGGGWSIDNNGTRILLNINYSARNVENFDYKTIGISIGGLF